LYAYDKISKSAPAKRMIKNQAVEWVVASNEQYTTPPKKNQRRLEVLLGWNAPFYWGWVS
jgi:hypothetical protein